MLALAENQLMQCTCIAKLQVKQMDQDQIIPVTDFTEAIESIAQYPLIDSDADEPLKMRPRPSLVL
jgi:hypothetical protein